MPYLEGKPKEETSMALNRENQKVGKIEFRESCTYGQTEFVEPKFYAVHELPIAAYLKR